MANGIRKLRKIQLGRETTAGTAVAATALWRGIGTLEDNLSQKEVEEDIGFLSPLDRFYISSYLGKLQFENIPATYEQIPYILEAGVKAVNTGSSDGSGSGKIYAYSFSTNASNTVNTYTLEGGDNAGAERMAYSFVQKFKLSGKGGEAWMVNADWVGRQISTTTFTGSINPPSVTDILFQNTKVYLDATSGTAGTTQISNTVLAADVDVTTGLKYFWTADGNLYFTTHKVSESDISINVTMEYNGSSIAEIANWRGGTSRQLAIIVTGPALTTAGTTYSNKTLKMVFSGHWQKFTKIGEQDSDDIVTGTFIAKYNQTSANYAALTVVNELSSLT